jgi:ribokinase
MPGKVFVIGSANVDLTVKVERLPEVGETVSDGEFYTSFGGKGANQAVAAHRAGASVMFMGRVGQDENGRAILNRLKECGLDTSLVQLDPEHPSGVALIMVDRQGRNKIAVAPGANRHIDGGEIRRAESLMRGGGVMLLQLEVPVDAVGVALKTAKRHDLITILNPAPVRPLPSHLFELVDILVPNEREALVLAGLSNVGSQDLLAAAMSIIRLGAHNVIVTLGERGALWVHGDHVVEFDAFSVEAVDSTAAGDAFCGALACALAEGLSLDEAIPFALAAGAITVTRRGAQDSLPSREEIEALLSRRHRSLPP